MGSNNVNSLTYNSYGKLIIDGKTIFDYSGVNVTSNDVKSGLKYVDKTGGIITGTMPSIGNKTYTPTTTEQILPVNTLIGSNVKVAGDQNLISSKILEDTSIFGVQGNAANIPIENYSVNGYYAICLGTGAISFSGDTNIYGVVFRNCTTTSASSGFYNDTNLKYVYNFPTKLSNGYRMFMGCSSLTNFYVNKLPTTLTSGYSMFEGCTALKSADFLQEGLSDVTRMFNGCTSLASVDYIPSTISAVSTMFTSCSAMRTINTINCPGPTYYTISNGIRSYITTIKNFTHSNLYQCFHSHSNLTNFGGFSGAAANATIGNYAFYSCTKLNSATCNINLPNTVTDATYAYSYATNIRDVALPANLKNGSYMFAYTNAIKNIKGAASNWVNAYRMFYQVTGLNVNIETLPASLTDTTYMFNGASGVLNVDKFYCGSINKTGSNFGSMINNVNTFKNSNNGTIFQSTSVKRINNIENLVNGYGMFQSCSALTYANFYKSANTLTNMAQMFSSANVSPIIGFQEDNKVDFSSLTNCYGAFTYFNGSKWNTIRISSKTTSDINLTQCFQSASTIKKVILNIPNSSTVTMTNMFKSCTTLTDLYINTKVAPTMTQHCFNGKSTGVRLNIYIPSGSAINTAFYNSGMSSTSYFPQAMNWTLNSDGSYYNTTYNYYIYPILNANSAI